MYCMKRIEPSPGLVDTLGNKIGSASEARGIQIPETFLRIRHGP